MKTLFYLIILVLCTSVSAEPAAKDHLNTGLQIEFNQTVYYLAWSDNPSENYYKQEYLQHQSSLEDYTEMLTLDVLAADVTAPQAIQNKVAELKRRRMNDPVTNYAVYEKEGDYVLDFVLTDGAQLLEWNMYRYIEMGNGADRMLVLIAYTYREVVESGDIGEHFFTHIKTTRNEIIEALAKIDLPDIRLK